MGLSAIIQLVNLAAPGIISIVQTIRHKDGSSTTSASIFTILDENDAQFAANATEFNTELAKLNVKKV